MDIQDFRERGIALYGKHGWISQLAPEIGKRRQTLHRYLNGTTPIPRSVELAMDALRDRKVRDIADPARAASPDPTSAGGGPVAGLPPATGRSQA